MKYLIVGYGNIGHKRQVALGGKCVATVDPDPRIRADFRDYKKVPLNLFDAAVLTIPQKLKFPFTEYFLSKGKHVLVEKPLLLTPAQGKYLAELIKKTHAVLYTSYNHRFEPNIVKIQKLLDKGTIGKLYHARFVYSFGNIKERINTWRETKNGVLEEIAPHQIDFARLFFGYQGKDFKILIARKIESKIYDHWVYETIDNKLILDCSAVTWKNIFLIEIYGQKSSIHMNGLRKWGGSELIIRERVLPSGPPKEKRTYDKGPDVTWKKDFVYFEKLVKIGQTTLDNDLEVSTAIQNLSR